MEEKRVAVIGLGYVGLPLAIEFAHKFPTVGFDINAERLSALRAGQDATREIDSETLKASNLTFSSELKDIKGCNVFIITVPTPIDSARQPDLRPILSASRTVGQALQPGGIVVYESTVYPGCTEEECVPILEKESGLRFNQDFFCGYSPERINPGDKEHTFTKIQKIVSGSTPAVATLLADLYGQVVTAGIYTASSIRVAEAAKVIENTQRDLNIALVNELSLIFDRAGISTEEVLRAAGTKWNFLPFRPGLVGGHCIGVDPYYLTHKAEQLGYHPQVILAGRRINDGMSSFIAQKTIQMLIQNCPYDIRQAKIGILGVTFKENVPDLRNSKVPDIYFELKKFGLNVIIHDPYASVAECQHEYGLTLAGSGELRGLDACILAVPHVEFIRDTEYLRQWVKPDGILLDVKSALFDRKPEGLHYWAL